MTHFAKQMRLAFLVAYSLSVVGVRADCYTDFRGITRCSGLSIGARIGIAIAILAVFIILALGAYTRRRQMIQRSNMAYVNQNQSNYQNQANYGGPPPPPSGFAQSYSGSPYPQYPPQSYSGYDAGASYTPPPGPPPPAQSNYNEPPAYYAPPPNAPPPNVGGKGEGMP